MILSTHALVGAAIGKTINNPWLIIPTVITTHFILDSLRHGEYFDKYKASVKEIILKVAADIFVGFSIIFLLLYFAKTPLENLINILIGTFFSMFPDLITAIFWWLLPKNKILKKITDFHLFCHRYTRWPKLSPERAWAPRNAVNDIIFSFIAIIFLLL